MFENQDAPCLVYPDTGRRLKFEVHKHIYCAEPSLMGDALFVPYKNISVASFKIILSPNLNSQEP